MGVTEESGLSVSVAAKAHADISLAVEPVKYFMSMVSISFLHDPCQSGDLSIDSPMLTHDYPDSAGPIYPSSGLPALIHPCRCHRFLFGIVLNNT